MGTPCPVGLTRRAVLSFGRIEELLHTTALSTTIDQHTVEPTFQGCSRDLLLGRPIPPKSYITGESCYLLTRARTRASARGCRLLAGWQAGSLPVQPKMPNATPSQHQGPARFVSCHSNPGFGHSIIMFTLACSNYAPITR